MSTSRRRRRRLDYSLTSETSASNSNDHFTDAFSTRRSALYHASTSDTSLYKDSGDCGCICEYCNAFFWFEERCVSASVNRYPRYTQCCKGGIVKLPFVRTYSPAIVQLFSQPDFLANIRAYNAMFSMTSFGAKIDDSVNNGSAPYVFKIEGQVHHWIGSLCPPANERPRFLQMYIYDTENEVSNRLHAFTGSNHSPLSPQIVSLLSKELEHSNELIKLFHTARDLLQSCEAPEFYIRLYDCHNTPCYDRPSSNSIGAIVTDNEPMSDGFDIVIRSKGEDPKRISKLHSLYMPLQYPLLFVHGESGWSPKMLCNIDATTKNRKLTMNMFYSYQLHDRQNMYTLVLRSGRLSQQYFVDAYISIEQSRLDYIRFNQNTFRTELYQGVEDAVTRGDTEGRDIGKRTILPSSFTGGPRYMYKHYQDALAICRVHGNPQYFITFTCNVKWPEIERYMSQYPSLKANDRPDIIARVFQMKVSSLISFLKSNKPFGEVTADLYTIEYQKRGLPHCHLLIWVDACHKIVNAEDIDKYITAEIPDPVSDPQLHKVISDLMMHGPCGIARPSLPCMKKGSCSKNFPKHFQLITSFDKNGYAQYKRRDTASRVTRNNISLDNRYVIPYNRLLCLHYQAHINVEYCGWSMLIKYLFKYISKGTDRIRYRISKGLSNSDDTSTTNDCHIDEIQNFVDSRFICPHEACWRIFNFAIHCRNPAVQVISVHEEHMQTITFRDNDHLANVLSNPTVGHTTLTGWLHNNRHDDRGLALRYIDYVSDYRWDTSGKCWIRRSYKTKPAIGRLAYVHPSCGERFYLRMLLTHPRGCRTFKDIRTVGGHVCSTYRDACDRLGLLGDDREWSNAFNEAAAWGIASELRTLFTHMLLYCNVSKPLDLWNEQWEKMADDIRLKHRFTNPEDLQQQILYEVELLLCAAPTPSTLSQYGLPMPNEQHLALLRNRLIMEEKNYNRQALAAEHNESKGRLNAQQREIYEHVMTNLALNEQVLAFVYGHGGTGKTFLWSTIACGLRSQGKIVLAVAASGIASLLLPAGRTAHSRFKIPIDLSDDTTCNIKKNTQLGQLLTETTLIIWDEAPMSNHKCFEALDRSLRDLLNNVGCVFGGKSIVLGGDFRQTLPIIKRASKQTILSSSLARSYLWNKFKIFKLSVNMRLQRPGLSEQEKTEISTFSSWLLAIGDGLIGTPDPHDPQDTRNIQIPPQYIIPFHETALADLIKFIYDDDTLHSPSASTLSMKAIICPKNETTDEINTRVLNMAPGTSATYHSTDTIIPQTGNNEDTDLLYPVEYLNMLNFKGMPPHKLELKVNTPVILLRNLNPTQGLCNGTRLIVTQLLPAIVEVQIMTGTSIGHRVYIPRITLTHTDQELLFSLKRKQLPLKICYAMTINKSQGQSLNKIGVYLPQPVFSHGQLYVALSRSTNPSALKLLIAPNGDNKDNETKNVVYKDFIREINSQ